MKRLVILVVAVVAACSTPHDETSQGAEQGSLVQKSPGDVSVAEDGEHIVASTNVPEVAAHDWEASSSFGHSAEADGSSSQHIVNRTFEYVTRFARQPLLLVRELNRTTYDGAEGADSRLTVEAYTGPDFRTPVWRITGEADGGEAWNRYYRMVKQGCCGAEDLYQYFSLANGTWLTDVTYRVLRLNGPQGSERLIGYRSIGGVLPPPTELQDPEAFALLTFATDEQPINRIVLYSDRVDEDNLMWSPISMEVVSLTGSQERVRSTEGHGVITAYVNEFTNLGVRLVFYDEIEVFLPIVDDQLLTDGATLPSGARADMLVGGAP